MFTLVFAAAPLVALGLVAVPAGAALVRREPPAAERGGTAHWQACRRRRLDRRPTVPRLDPAVAALLRRDPAGLVAAVVQQHDTGEVLMLAWMDDEALHRTLTTGRATYWSRSRGEYWVKGETSGNRQWVREVRARLRRRRAAAAGRPGGPGLPHRRAQLLLPRAARRREAAAMSARRPPRAGVRRRSTQPIVPVTRRLLADSETAVGVYRKLARNRPGTVLLESAEQGKRWSRYSFVGVRSAGVLTERDGVTQWLGDPLPGITDDLPADPLAAVRTRGPPAALARAAPTCRR